MEYVKGKSLYDYLKTKPGRKLQLSEAKRIFRQVISGMAYCHERNISHRDIKLENILIDEDSNIKIIDFGFATCIPPSQHIKIFCGTAIYICPEIAEKREYCGGPADMWSLGVLLYNMLTGSFPFKSAYHRTLFKQISKGVFDIPLWMDKQAAGLITMLLDRNPCNRPLATDVLGHPFFLGEGGLSENINIKEMRRKSDEFDTFTLPMFTAHVEKLANIEVQTRGRVFSKYNSHAIRKLVLYIYIYNTNRLIWDMI